MGSDGASDGAASADPLVRPFGYVDDEPVVRRIGDYNLYLGNGHAPTGSDHDFEYVVSATQDAYPLTTHHCPLVDGPGNDWSAFERAVDTVRACYRSGAPTLVHCKAGISRSSTLIATTIAIEDGKSFSAALAIVLQDRPHAVVHPALRELAVVYLASHPTEPTLDEIDRSNTTRDSLSRERTP